MRKLRRKRWIGATYQIVNSSDVLNKEKYKGKNKDEEEIRTVPVIGLEIRIYMGSFLFVILFRESQIIRRANLEEVIGPELRIYIGSFFVTGTYSI
jgi:hypothetical protein